MPPSLALLLWFILLLGLLRYDPAKDPGISFALWVPVLWMFILGSRLPSQWLGGSVATAAQAFEEGSPIDRTFFFGLILGAIVVLMMRPFSRAAFFSRNIALVAFVTFTLVSVLWSDFPFVSFKRWFRDLGNYLVVLVVLSDPLPFEAIRSVLRRLCYLLVPLSVVLIKYYPSTGKQFSQWTGAAEFMGATTSKNMLGVVCLISGIFFFWDTVTRWSDRKERRTKRIIMVNVAFVAMTLWLLKLASSATSAVCLAMGCLIIVAAHAKMFRRRPGFLKFIIPAAFCLYLVLALGFNINSELAGAVGRDPTLTDRTGIWKTVLSMQTNPVLGTGYESFWLGPRLQRVWQSFQGINESHNGYLEVYLNLGLIGAFLIVVLLLASYRTISKKLTSDPTLASLSLALWTIVLFYNMTEAAFRSSLIWITFLLVAISVPARAEDHVHSTKDFNSLNFQPRGAPSPRYSASIKLASARNELFPLGDHE
jgi:exopolysaccharide production protein ExoQ